jgi:hypothetical protein
MPLTNEEKIFLDGCERSITEVLEWLEAQHHKPYLLGAENDAAPDNAKQWDCSELSQHAVTKFLRFVGSKLWVDGADAQYRHMLAHGIPVKDGTELLPLDLGFVWDRDAIGEHIGHVVISYDGMKHTKFHLAIEARGRPISMVDCYFAEEYPAMFGQRWAGWYRLPEMARYDQLRKIELLKDQETT